MAAYSTTARLARQAQPNLGQNPGLQATPLDQPGPLEATAGARGELRAGPGQNPPPAPGPHPEIAELDDTTDDLSNLDLTLQSTGAGARSLLPVLVAHGLYDAEVFGLQRGLGVDESGSAFRLDESVEPHAVGDAVDDSAAREPTAPVGGFATRTADGEVHRFKRDLEGCLIAAAEAGAK